MNPTQLPTPPELSQQRYEEIRAALLRSDDRSHRASHRWLVPAAVGLSTLAGIGVVGIAVVDDQSDRTAPVSRPALRAPVFDEPDENRERFEAQCREDLADQVARSSQTHEPRDRTRGAREPANPPGLEHLTDDFLDHVHPEEFRIFNYLSTPESGEFALLYSDDGDEMDCLRLAAWDRPLIGPFSRVDDQWLAGHIAGGSTHTDRNSDHTTFAGRVSDKIARVTVSIGSETVQARIANYTYIAVVGNPGSVDLEDLAVTIRGYDAAGNLLHETGRGGKPPIHETCWVTPDGKHLSGYDDTPDDECRPAPRWPMAN